jgi:iron complex transport system ATP-binding protein
LHTLSGGERQRAVLARVLAQQAPVLLLDEPISGLDVGHAQALLDLVDARPVADGVTVLSTLHDLTLAAQYADTLLLLDGGRVAATGTPAEVLTTEPAHRRPLGVIHRHRIFCKKCDLLVPFPERLAR